MYGDEYIRPLSQRLSKETFLFASPSIAVEARIAERVARTDLCPEGVRAQRGCWHGWPMSRARPERNVRARFHSSTSFVIKEMDPPAAPALIRTKQAREGGKFSCGCLPNTYTVPNSRPAGLVKDFDDAIAITQRVHDIVFTVLPGFLAADER